MGGTSVGAGRHRTDPARGRHLGTTWTLSDVAGHRDWYLHVILCGALAVAGPARPTDWAAWAISAFGVACLCSALAYRRTLSDGDAWGTEATVAVGRARFLWLHAHRLPLVSLLVLSAVYLVVTRLLGW